MCLLDSSKLNFLSDHLITYHSLYQVRWFFANFKREFQCCFSCFGFLAISTYFIFLLLWSSLKNHSFLSRRIVMCCNLRTQHYLFGGASKYCLQMTRLENSKLPTRIFFTTIFSKFVKAMNHIYGSSNFQKIFFLTMSCYATR